MNLVHNTPLYIYLRSILILSTHLFLSLPICSIYSGFPSKFLYAFLLSAFVQHALPISSCSTSPFQLNFTKNASYETLQYTVFSTILSLQSKYFQHRSQTLSPEIMHDLFDQFVHFKLKKKVCAVVAGVLRRKARVFRRDSPPTRSRRTTGSGGESSSMLTSVERRQLALKANEWLIATPLNFHEWTRPTTAQLFLGCQF
jgi:hypothetical protein